MFVAILVCKCKYNSTIRIIGINNSQLRIYYIYKTNIHVILHIKIIHMDERKESQKSIIQRIIEYRKQKGFKTQKEFCNFIDIKESTFSTYLSEKSKSIDYSLFLSLSNKFENLNLKWILTGAGEPENNTVELNKTISNLEIMNEALITQVAELKRQLEDYRKAEDQIGEDQNQQIS